MKVRKAQSFTEYIVLVSLVASAIIAMQAYIQRSVQGRVKDLTDAFIAPESDHLDELNETIPCLDGGLGTDACTVSAGGTIKKKTDSSLQLRERKQETGGAITVRKDSAPGAAHTFTSQSHYLVIDDPEDARHFIGDTANPDHIASGVHFNPTPTIPPGGGG